MNNKECFLAIFYLLAYYSQFNLESIISQIFFIPHLSSLIFHPSSFIPHPYH